MKIFSIPEVVRTRTTRKILAHFQLLTVQALAWRETEEETDEIQSVSRCYFERNAHCASPGLILLSNLLEVTFLTVLKVSNGRPALRSVWKERVSAVCF